METICDRKHIPAANLKVLFELKLGLYSYKETTGTANTTLKKLFSL